MRSTSTIVLGLLAAGALALPPHLPAQSHGHEQGRYGCRFESLGSRPPTFKEMPDANASRATDFDPIVETIVSLLTEADYTQTLRQLSGDLPAPVWGTPVTIETRYSLSADEVYSTQFAFEQLAQLGFEVRYHEYSQSGNDLRNIVATLPGTERPNEIYVLGGHIDSISEQAAISARGAEDNASGSAGILTAARALAGYAFESTIELVLFTGEEQGLWGSRAYVNDTLAEGKDLKAAVTFDMIANSQTDYGVLIEGETEWVDLMNVMADAVDTFTDISREFSFFSFGSDHVPFQDRGIPAILCIDLDWAEYPHYHRATDTFEQTEPDLGTKIARAGLASVAQLATPVGEAAAVPSPNGVSHRLSVGPNPASSYTTIGWARSTHGESITIFDLSGRRVRDLGSVGETRRRVVWDLKDDQGIRVANGAYWVSSGDDIAKIVVLP